LLTYSSLRCKINLIVPDYYYLLNEEEPLPEIQSLARGLMILERLANTPDGLGITELAEQFEVDKGSMSRLLQTMASYGFAEKDAVTHRYILGPQIIRLSRVLLTRMPLRETAKPYLQQLVDATGECAHLAILAQGQALYIDQVESPSALRVATGVGTMAPLHPTALGKVLLAWANAPLPSELQSFTVRTITDMGVLKHHLDMVRQQGYALDDEEYQYGVRCIATPVFDYRDKCVGAIGVSSPSTRLPLESIHAVAQVVVNISKDLTTRLSFKTEPEKTGAARVTP
jgi:IclR family transcriptional regulator, KDG regulon repressor